MLTCECFENVIPNMKFKPSLLLVSLFGRLEIFVINRYVFKTHICYSNSKSQNLSTLENQPQKNYYPLMNVPPKLKPYYLL